MTRFSLPGEFYLDAALLNPAAQTRIQLANAGLNEKAGKNLGWALPDGNRALGANPQAAPSIALRWVLNPALGIPLAPFTVWQRPAFSRPALQPIANLVTNGSTHSWDASQEMLQISVKVTSGSAMVVGYSVARDPVAVVTLTGPGTAVLEGGPMLSFDVQGGGTIGEVKGLSVNAMANSAGWVALETVGLPLTANAGYYAVTPQGPVGGLKDPRSAALDRLAKWGPQVGWLPLLHLPPWQRPKPDGLMHDLEQDLLAGLQKMLQGCPPPNLEQQVDFEVSSKFTQDDPAVAQKLQSATARTRPLQALSIGVSSDSFLSLALGFGTGASAELASVAAPPIQLSSVSIVPPKGTDFMVTAPWKGTVTIVEEPTGPWPPLVPKPAIHKQVQMNRELCAVVLSPKARDTPASPVQVQAGLDSVDGAQALDGPVKASVAIHAARPEVLATQPRTAGYALARFANANSGQYVMRQYPAAGSLMTLATALRELEAGQVPDENTAAAPVMLRDHGVDTPDTGTGHVEYAVAAVDLFGQWSGWSSVGVDLLPVPVGSPVVVSTQAKAVPGTGGGDPCQLTVTVEVQWNWLERSCSQMQLAVVIGDTPPPPALIEAPAAVAQAPLTLPPGTARVAVLAFSAAGAPSSTTAGVTAFAISNDGQQVFPAEDTTKATVRHFRVVVSGIPVSYNGALEKAVTVYAAGEERVRPGVWSPAWSTPKEAAIAANPIPPVMPAVVKDLPDFAGLPDAAGISYAAVRWATGGPNVRYRLYEASEAALLQACNVAAPDLHAPLSDRLAALFSLYKDPKHLDALQKAFRKVVQEPVLPPVVAAQHLWEVALPRGSALIHCVVIVAVTPANLTSAWPLPDAKGKSVFLPFVVPERRQCPQPRVSGSLQTTAPDLPASALVRVSLEGRVAASRVLLYRAGSSVLARDTGAMTALTPVSVSAANLADGFVDIPDAGLPGWNFTQYRAVLLAADDRDHAGLGVPSRASAPFALLVAPVLLPVPGIAANAPGSTAAVAAVAVGTTAPRTEMDAGDHVLRLTVHQAGGSAVNWSSALQQVPVFASVALMVAAGGPALAGYCGGALFLRLPRTPGQSLDVSLDIVDPLQRSVHVAFPVAALPGLLPQLTGLNVVRAAGAVIGNVQGQVPSDATLSAGWQLTLVVKPLAGGALPQVVTMKVNAIQMLPSPAAFPGPAALPGLASRVGALQGPSGARTFLFWVRSAVAAQVEVHLSDGAGHEDVAVKVVP